MSMLTELVKYAQRQVEECGLTTEPGFKDKDARWAIDIAADGRFLGVLLLGEQGQGRRFCKCPDLKQSELTGGEEGGRRSQFLLHTAEVVALYAGRDAQGEPQEVTDEKIRSKHDYFVRLLREASSVMPELALAADCLETSLPEIRAALAEHRARNSDGVTLRIGGAFPVESPTWHDWWRQFRHNLLASLPREQAASHEKRRCFVTGELTAPARTHPQIRLAAVGGKSIDSSLISFDEEAFWSGGLRQSENYSVSESAATAYAAALNHLLEVAPTLAGTKIAHWYEGAKPDGDDPVLASLEGVFSTETEEISALEHARKLLEAIRTGQRPELLRARYFAITLSANRGRAVVRDWMHGSFEELTENVVAWFEDLSIRLPGGSMSRPPKFSAVLRSLLPPKRRRESKFDDLPAPFVAQMWHVAVRNEPIPRCALPAAVRRVVTSIVSDEEVPHEAVGLIKAYHIRKARLRRKEGGVMPEDFKPEVNPNHPSPAYHCGRLMAVYADLQRAALPTVGAGVVQRYYAAASATPALILGRLARLSQAHLGKLESSGLARWYEQRLADIWSRIGDAVPRVLDLEEQSLFALGYYQELANSGRKEPDAAGPETSPAEGEDQPAGDNAGES